MKSLFLILGLILGVLPVNAQWTQQVNGMSDWSVTALYADAETLYAGATTGVFKSTDNGDNWAAVGTGLPVTPRFNAIVRSGSVLVAGGEGSGIWLSSDYGSSWTQTTSGVSSTEYVSTFLVEGNTVYGAFGDPSSVGISTNNGVTWTKHSSGLQTTQQLTGIAKIGSYLYACHATMGVYVSTNNGSSWTITSPIGAQNKNALIASGNSLVVATLTGLPSQNGLFHSPDSGSSWAHVVTGPRMTGFGKNGSTIYAVGDSLFRSTNNGQTWIPLNLDGWPGTAVWNTMQFTQNYAFVNFYGVGVYRSLISALVSVKDLPEKGIPVEFMLEQNYPNPFNPTTSVRFQLPIESRVTLKVFNLLGEEVATLVDEFQDAGFKTIEWNAATVPSGTYFLKMQAGEFVSTRKLLLMK